MKPFKYTDMIITVLVMTALVAFALAGNHLLQAEQRSRIGDPQPDQYPYPYHMVVIDGCDYILYGDGRQSTTHKGNESEPTGEASCERSEHRRCRPTESHDVQRWICTRDPPRLS